MIAVAWVKFNDRKEPIQTEVCEVCPGVVNVRTLNLEDYTGFKMYMDRGMQMMMGDYSTYKKKYKEPDPNGMYAAER